MIGPAILFLLALSIARHGGGWFTTLDFAFLAILGAFLGFRSWEFRTYAPPAAENHPFRRSSLLILAFGLAVWTGANLIGNRGS